MALTGRMGMTKAMKRAARLSSMTTNRKRDKREQRSRYHREFANARGQSTKEIGRCGFVISTTPLQEIRRWKK